MWRLGLGEGRSRGLRVHPCSTGRTKLVCVCFMSMHMGVGLQPQDTLPIKSILHVPVRLEGVLGQLTGSHIVLMHPSSGHCK